MVDDEPMRVQLPHKTAPFVNKSIVITFLEVPRVRLDTHFAHGAVRNQMHLPRRNVAIGKNLPCRGPLVAGEPGAVDKCRPKTFREMRVRKQRLPRLCNGPA
jgi:hypothetical protein